MKTLDRNRVVRAAVVVLQAVVMVVVVLGGLVGGIYGSHMLLTAFDVSNDAMFGMILLVIICVAALCFMFWYAYENAPTDKGGK